MRSLASPAPVIGPRCHHYDLILHQLEKLRRFIERLELNDEVRKGLKTHLGHLFATLEKPKNTENRPAADRDEPMLTGREREVMGWIAKGKSNWTIAEILEISPHTVDTHVRRAFQKLDAHDRTTAAIRAMQLGAVELSA